MLKPKSTKGKIKMKKGQALYMTEDINTKFFFCGVVYDLDEENIYIYDNTNPKGYRKHIYNIKKMEHYISVGLAKFKKATWKQLENKGE